MLKKMNVQQCLRWAAAVARYLIGCVIIALLLLTLAPSALKLAVIRLYLWLTEGKKLEILAGIDAIFFYFGQAIFTDGNCVTTINAAARLQGAPDVHQLRQAIKDRWLESRTGPKGLKKYPRLTQKVTRKFGYYVWQEAENDICLEEQIRLHSEGYRDTASLVRLMEKVITVPLRMDRPLWECLVIPKIGHASGDSPDEHAVLLRVHHSLGDGFLCLQMVSELYEGQSIEESTLGMEGLLEKSAFIKSNRFIRFMASPPTRITAAETMRIVFDAVKILLDFPLHCLQIFNLKEDINALHLPKKVISGRKLLGFSRNMDLQLFKDVARASRCTVNDVYLHLLARLFARCNEDVLVATDPTVRAMFVIFVMPASRWSQNGITCIGIDLPVHEGSSETGLRTIADKCQEAKSSSMAFTNFLLLNMAGNHLPLPLAKLMLVQVPAYSTVCSNLVGPPNIPYILGSPMTELLVVPNGSSNVGASFSFVSLAGKVRLGVMVDRMVAPSDQIAWQLADMFEEEFHKLNVKTALEIGNKNLLQ